MSEAPTSKKRGRPKKSPTSNVKKTTKEKKYKEVAGMRIYLDSGTVLIKDPKGQFGWRKLSKEEAKDRLKKAGVSTELPKEKHSVAKKTEINKALVSLRKEKKITPTQLKEAKQQVSKHIKAGKMGGQLATMGKILLPILGPPAVEYLAKQLFSKGINIGGYLTLEPSRVMPRGVGAENGSGKGVKGGQFTSLGEPFLLPNAPLR